MQIENILKCIGWVYQFEGVILSCLHGCWWVLDVWLWFYFWTVTQ